MHRFRFFGLRSSDKNTWLVEGGEHQHLSKVLRLKLGATVEVADGEGTSIIGSINEITKNHSIILTSEEKTAPRPTTLLRLALGAIKPKDLDDLIPSVVELGVDELILFGQKGVAKDRTNAKSMERWRRIVKNAVKQCKRPYIPEIVTRKNLAAVIDKNKSTSAGIYLDETCNNTAIETVWSKNQDLLIIVGGELGLSDDERQILEQNNFRPIPIGPNILRATTATTAAASVAAFYRPL